MFDWSGKPPPGPFDLGEEVAVWEGPFMTLHQRPFRKKGLDRQMLWTYAKVPGAKFVAACIPLTSDGELIFNKIYRVTQEAWVFEPVVGLVNPGEQIHVAAGRELKEETGYVTARPLIPIFTGLTNPSMLANLMSFWLALDVKKSHEPELEPEEAIEVMKVPFNHVFDFMLDGETLVDLKMYAMLEMTRNYLRQTDTFVKNISL